MDKNTNNLLILGICILAFGLILLAYSVSSYTETKNLEEKIDFEALETNNQMPDSEKYFQYLSNSDFLNKKLNQNKNLLIKNASCAYVDYAQHNAIALYRLVNLQSDTSRKNVALGNIQSLYDTLNYYKSCKNYSLYKDELKNILETEKNKKDDLYTQDRMNTFLDDEYIENELEKESLIEEPKPYSQPTYSETMQTGGTY